MKKLSRTIAVLLAVCLLCGILAGCGSNGEPGAEATDNAGGTVWVPEYTALPDELGGGVNSAVMNSEYIYFSASVSSTDEETGEETYRSAIFKASTDGTSCVELPGFSGSEPDEGMLGGTSISCLALAPNGDLWVVENIYAYHYELGGATVDEGTEGAEYVDDGSTYVFRRLGTDGEEISSFTLDSAVTEASDWFSVDSLVCDADGNLFFSDGNGVIHAYDAEGNELFTLADLDWVDHIITTADGSAAASSNGQSGYEIRLIDTAAKGWGKTVTLSDYPENLYSGGGDYYFLYNVSGMLYGWNADTGAGEPILTWLDSDIDSYSLQSVRLLDDGSLFCVESSYNSGKSSIIKLTEQPKSSVAEKTELTLASMYLSQNMRAEIIDFNKTSDSYRIVATDYSQYNTDDNYSAGLTKLSTEILSGNVPDIIDVTSLPIDQYAAKGLLEDLYPYLDADAELSRDDLVPSILSAMETDGKLYQASSGFYILTVIGLKDKVGSQMGWTLQDMMDCLAEQPEGTDLFSTNMTQTDMLSVMCYMNMGSFVDWDTQSCNFNSADFIQLLNFCSMFPKTFEYSEATYESDASRIQSGKQLLLMTTLSNFQDYQMYSAMFGGDIMFKGFPVESGIGNTALLDDGLAISSTCQNKDAAWSFVRRLFTEKYQAENWDLPTNRNAFDAALKKATTPTYTTNEKGEQVEQSTGGVGWDDFYIDLYAVTQEQADGINELIGSVSRLANYDESIINIVSDEAASFFAGDKTAEETAQIIQSRVAIYVSEQS